MDTESRGAEVFDSAVNGEAQIEVRRYVGCALGQGETERARFDQRLGDAGEHSVDDGFSLLPCGEAPPEPARQSHTVEGVRHRGYIEGALR